MPDRKFPKVQSVQKILETGSIHRVLDLGAGRGFLTLYALSYGVDHVTAVDKLSRKHFPDYLTTHPKITFLQEQIETFDVNQQYDLILLSNILPFLKRSFVCEKLIPTAKQHLTDNGFLHLTFFYPDDEILSPTNRANFTVDDFTGRDFEIFTSLETTHTQALRSGKTRFEHVHFLTLQKTS